MRWAGHVARVQGVRERDHLEDPGIHRRIILRWISGSGMGGGYGLDRYGSGYVKVAST
jgi:hypothetical protein